MQFLDLLWELPAYTVMIVAIITAAVLGGSVCGNHISPISDTTILSSTGAGCKHVNHVTTQMQYGIVVAIISVLSYIVAGLTENIKLGFGTGVFLLAVFVVTIKWHYRKEI